ncbi:hypothetical protein TRP8649_02903 [Pelagimonas phthalicica]|uniref:Uncharacterized protein n=1 Tax=Pelagimonas phthalicica TaxID=1037362 RepID=A0A238JF47_9RHOB|nr:hypothetical protein [Pelagimonas phthalicica]TDS91728.1 hypothetical protein CLV87_2904 [Pelagimonas phthalicica]SMX28777.1 hypothetical protein TRP8649_02903 [Pelagimonas phthalicica]
MSTGNTTEILLGCEPQVRVEIIEDNGNLFMRVVAPDPDAVDIDALFFNLADDVDASALTIYPDYDEAIGSNGENVTGFTVATGTLNQMDNGAQVQEPYDVRLEFGTTPYSSQGDVNEATLTFYIDGGGSNLTADSIDLSNLTAVVNTDNGGGMALTGGIGNTGDDQAAVYETNVLASDDFNGISYASQSDIVSYGGYWQATNGELEANGCHDGNIWFEPVAVNGDAEISFDARAPHTEYFENGGCYGDSLEVWALVDGNEWVLMDTFVVNDEGTALVGDTTGQTITADSQTLTYSGGALDGASSVQLVLDADISAGNEEIFIDNVEVSETVLVEGNDSGATTTETVEEVVLAENFDGVSNLQDAQNVAWNGGWHGGWQATNGEAEANGCHDGNLWFETAQVNGDAEVSFDARAPHTEYFENGGCYGDSLEVWALVDGNEWVLMDTFVVNDEGTALVGDTTGQTITADSQTLTYSGGALDGASSVQLVLDADISAGNEEIFIDNVEVSTLTEVEVPVDEHGTCEDFEDAAAGETAALQFDGFTVTAQRAGDAADSENDAMIFDTANPTGGDSDLGYADQGNAIIISEDNDATDPDDNAGGGTITFDFAAPSDVVSLNVLDIEEEGGAIDLYDSEGELIDSIAIPAAGDNSVQTIDIAVDGVASMQVTLAGSGAVDDLCYASETGGNCGQYDVTYDDLMKDADPAAVADDQTTADDQVDDMADAMV